VAVTTTITSSTANSASTTNPVSVASSTSAGAAGGSVINVSSLVSQLVAADEAPQQSIIASQTQAVTAQVSALATFKSALSTFQSSLSSLSTSSGFNVKTAGSSDQTVFTASAQSGAPVGSFQVTVSALASAQQLLSGAFSAANPVGTGTLTLSLGSSSFNVSIDSTDSTLSGIAAAINSASGNPGITATIVNGTDGAHLLLSSALTGAANTIQVTVGAGGGGLSALAYGGTNTSNYTQQSAAHDAGFSVAGVPYTSASNTVSNAISGVTLTLLGKSAANTSATLNVASDTSTITSNISGFVGAYNTLAGQLTSLGSYDATSGTAGPMLGDALLTGMQSQLQRALQSVVNTGSTQYTSLASIGITSQKDGTLALNSQTLATALSTNVSAVSTLFSGKGGVAAALNGDLTGELASGGAVDTRSQSLTKQENALTDQSNKLNTQMSALSTGLTLQYSKLNALLSSLQTTSSYLTQAINSLPTNQNRNTG
jgi:flagellar hook-associated protein 2